MSDEFKRKIMGNGCEGGVVRWRNFRAMERLFESIGLDPSKPIGYCETHDEYFNLNCKLCEKVKESGRLRDVLSQS